jgi:hypothetical protein
LQQVETTKNRRKGRPKKLAQTGGIQSMANGFFSNRKSTFNLEMLKASLLKSDLVGMLQIVFSLSVMLWQNMK